MKILFTGGGTLGTVTPLIAVYKELIARGAITQYEALWLGTRKGPERNVVVKAGIRFVSIFSGKIRRYIHWRNVIDPFLFLAGFVQALLYVARFRPAVMLNAGSFVGVPAVFASWFFGVPVVILQLDCEPTRSNIISAPFARRIGVSLPEIKQFFPKEKTSVVGIPTHTYMYTHIPSRPNTQTIVVTGGGTGARALNELVLQSLAKLTKQAEVIHITGKNKEGESVSAAVQSARYHPRAYVGNDEMLAMFASADVVVTRAGMGTLAELSVLGATAIIIPIPNFHQEKNAAYFKQHDAAVVFSQEELTVEEFVNAILSLLNDEERKRILQKNISGIFPSDSASRVADIVQKAASAPHE